MIEFKLTAHGGGKESAFELLHSAAAESISDRLIFKLVPVVFRTRTAGEFLYMMILLTNVSTSLWQYVESEGSPAR